MTVRSRDQELRDFAKFLSGHVLGDLEITAGWSMQQDGQRKVLTLLETDSMGLLFDWLTEAGSPTVLCVKEAKGYSIVTMETVPAQAEHVHDEDVECAVNERSEVGMFLAFLRQRKGPTTFHKVAPVDIKAEEQMRSLVDA